MGDCVLTDDCESSRTRGGVGGECRGEHEMLLGRDDR